MWYCVRYTECADFINLMHTFYHITKSEDTGNCSHPRLHRRGAPAKLDEQTNQILSPESNDDINSFPGSNLLTIPGVGPKTLAAILSCVGESGQAFSTGVKLIGHIGFFPQIYESGETRRANKMSNKGPAYLRHALYIASVACLKHNIQLRNLYHTKISQGKKPKQALICVAKKLSHLCLSMLHSGQDYNPARVFSYV